VPRSPRPARLLAAALALVAATSVARAQLPEEPPPHHYEIIATLDPEAHRIVGSVDIRFTNTSNAPLTELVFHLYMNAFENEETVFMKESRSSLRGVRAEGEGSIALETLRVEGVDRLGRADDELVEGDRTQLRVPLTEAIAPGDEAHISATFTTQLPPLFARAGYSRDFHVGAQFFPKLAKLEPDGTWASFPYHGNGEFYADFARYELVVDVPEGWTVGATGARTSERSEGSRTVFRFEQAWVHDTVFVAAPWLQELLGREGDVAIRVLHPPGYGSAAERHLEVTRAGLRHFGEMLGPYPYAQLTVVVPPRGAEGGAGMEYPTLFLTAGPWMAMPRLPFAAQDEVTAHELGHQWFQGLVATNEVAHPMLDEGLTEWITGDLLQELHGRERSGVALPFLRLDGFAIRRAWSLSGERATPPASAVHEFRSSTDYGRSVYARTSTVLETVARSWGREKLRRTLGRYARRHRFGHPEPADLYAAFDQSYGPWMARRVLRPALEEGELASFRIMRFEPGDEGARVTVQRLGPIPLPTQLRVVRGDRSVEWIPLSGHARFDGTIEGDVRSVRVDAARNGLLDRSRLDDGAGERPSTGLFARALHFAQALLGALGP
jgi:hypothetical protein